MFNWFKGLFVDLDFVRDEYSSLLKGSYTKDVTFKDLEVIPESVENRDLAKALKIIKDSAKNGRLYRHPQYTGLKNKYATAFGVRAVSEAFEVIVRKSLVSDSLSVSVCFKHNEIINFQTPDDLSPSDWSVVLKLINDARTLSYKPKEEVYTKDGLLLINEVEKLGNKLWVKL